MLSQITLLTSFLFAITYPACLLTSYKNPIGHYFHRFHLALPAIVAALIVIFMEKILTVDFLFILFWAVFLFIVTYFNWNKENTNFLSVILSSLVGTFAFVLWINQNIELSNMLYLVIVLIGGLIFSISLYAMNLGHFYLNVPGLSLVHLKRTTYAFIIFLIIRFFWDIIALLKFKVFYDGELYSVWKFSMTLEGGLLWVAILFGTIFPLGCSYFVLETLRLKNTQSATGILYVLLCGVLLGDITYKYYSLTYSIFM